MFLAAASRFSSLTPLDFKNFSISLPSTVKSSRPNIPSSSNSIITSSASLLLILPSLNIFASVLPVSELPKASLSPSIAFFVVSSSGISFLLSKSQFPVILMLKSSLIFAPYIFLVLLNIFYF